MKQDIMCNHIECEKAEGGRDPTMVADQTLADEDTWDQDTMTFSVTLTCPVCGNSVDVIQDYSTDVRL